MAEVKCERCRDLTKLYMHCMHARCMPCANHMRLICSEIVADKVREHLMACEHHSDDMFVFLSRKALGR